MRLVPIAAALLLAARACAAASPAPSCEVAALVPQLPAARFDRCALLRAPAAGTAPSGDGDPSPAIRLLWRTPKPGDALLTLGVHVDAPLETLGYVGVGPSWNGGMRGAELWIASLVSGGDLSLRSYWSDDYVQPSRAGAPLVLLAWESALGGGTAWAFTRSANGTAIASPSAADADFSHIPLLRVGGDTFLFAVGVEPGEFSYHSSLRGSARVSLIAASSDAAPLVAKDASARTLRVVTPPVATDGTPSRYCWSWHRLPSDRKYHIARVAPILAHPELRGLVHHRVTYACPSDFESSTSGGADAAALRAGRVVCRAEGGMPPACPQNYIGWADAGTIEYPPEAGFPFGAGETRSILLEVHYENLGRAVGIVDTSGLEFTFTPTLRPHDLGYLIVGDALERQAPAVQRAPQVLPSGYESYEVANLCPASCTRRMVGGDGGGDGQMHVVSTTFHQHVKGTHAYLELFRDGRRAGRLAQPHWDFTHQDAIPGAGLNIRPGDELLTRCVFNTRNASALQPPYTFGAGAEHDVVGGFGTYDAANARFEEMCYACAYARGRRMCCACAACPS